MIAKAHLNLNIHVMMTNIIINFKEEFNMARNKKPEYINKLFKIQTSNGFKVDVANYLYNPSYSHEYPNLEREDNNTLTVVRYFKFYNGGGQYEKQIFTLPENKDGNGWQILSPISEEVIEQSNRFSMNKLIKIAETI